MLTRAERENEAQRDKIVDAIIDLLDHPGTNVMDLSVRELCRLTGTTSPRFYRSCFPTLADAVVAAGTKGALRIAQGSFGDGEVRAILAAASIRPEDPFIGAVLPVAVKWAVGEWEKR